MLQLGVSHNILERPFTSYENKNENIVEVGNTYLERLFEDDTYMHAANSPVLLSYLL